MTFEELLEKEIKRTSLGENAKVYIDVNNEAMDKDTEKQDYH